MKVRRLWGAALMLSLSACPSKEEQEEQPMTLAEASQAVQEAVLDGQAACITSNTIEISTTFTLGQAVEKAAEEIRSFVESQLPCAGVTRTKRPPRPSRLSQLPCAGVTLEGAKLTVEYGKIPGNCTYRGQTYEGTHLIEVKRTEPGEVEVRHGWLGVSNQRVKVDGTATVTWSASAKSRRVQHELIWTGLSDGRTGKGTGDRTQTPLAGGLSEGIKIEGVRSWTSTKGTWDLAIRGVEARWVDPIPQAGSYTLVAPSGRAMALEFTRLDKDTIRVTVSSGKRSFEIKVNSVGHVVGDG